MRGGLCICPVHFRFGGKTFTVINNLDWFLSKQFLRKHADAVFGKLSKAQES